MPSKTIFLAAALFFVLTATMPADEKAADPKAAQPTEKAKDYADFSRLVHKIVTNKMPKEVTDVSGWGGTIPIPDNLRFPRLPRTRIKVGDRDELPHGLWRKLRVTIDDPNKDIVMDVKDFKKIDNNNYRLTLDTQASVHGEVELYHWQKGLPLFRIVTQADATLGALVDCDVAVSIKPKTFPPELQIEPKVKSTKLTLRQFELKKVGNLVEGDKAREIGNDVKDYLQQGLDIIEPEVRLRINEAIGEGIREGRGTISAATLLRVLTGSEKK